MSTHYHAIDLVGKGGEHQVIIPIKILNLIHCRDRAAYDDEIGGLMSRSMHEPHVGKSTDDQYYVIETYG